MNYLKIGLDSPVSVFDICQAHQQLESDYNVGGWVRERPSNQRRKESTGCQLSRMKFTGGARWVDICVEPEDEEDGGDDDVRDIYLRNVLKWGLPIDTAMMAAINRSYTPDFVACYPQCAGDDYLQGKDSRRAI